MSKVDSRRSKVEGVISNQYKVGRWEGQKQAAKPRKLTTTHPGCIGDGMEITMLLHDCSLDGESGYSATCVEFPEANGQGETPEECVQDLRAAVHDVLEFRREEARKALTLGDKLEVIAA